MFKKIKKGIIIALASASFFSAPAFSSFSPVIAYAATYQDVINAAASLEKWADANGKQFSIFPIGEFTAYTQADADEILNFLAESYKMQQDNSLDEVFVYDGDIIFEDNLFTRTISLVDESGNKVGNDVVQTAGTTYKDKSIHFEYKNTALTITENKGTTTTTKWPAYTPSTFTDFSAKTSENISSKTPTANETGKVIYQRVNRTVTFNANGGTGTMAAQTVKSGLDTTITANKFTRAGYTFNGWNTKADGTGTKYTNTIKTSANTTLYAQWTPNVLTINYYAGVATGDSKGAWTNTSNNLMRTVKHNYDGEDFKVYGFPNSNGGTWNLTKTGYYPTPTWLIGSTTSTKTISQDTAYATVQAAATALGVDLATGSKTVNLYAQMLPITYSVKFNGNGATSGSMANQSFTYDKAQNLTANAFVKTGYTFDGWATTATGAVVHTNKKSVNNLTATKNGTVNLYAHWKINTYNVTFNGNGSNGGSTAALSNKNYNTAQTLTANGFTRTGYTFDSWNTKADGTGTKYANKASFTIPASNTTLYAQWKPNTYTVTFVDGVGKTLKTQTVNYNTGATAPANPTRTGYTFNKWDKAFNNITANTTVTALWNINKYNVTFNANGGTGTMTALTSKDYNSSVTLTANAFTRTGYIFNGWNTASNGSGTSYANKASFKIPASNTTLYAQWKPNTYTVTFVDGTGKTLKTQTVNYNTGATAPANPTRTGYTFNGWDKTFNNITANTTVTAKWTPITVSVKYNGNGATSGSMNEQKFTYGTAQNLTANAFARTGYTFGGWSTTSTGAVAYTDKKSVNNLTSNITLYAKWNPITYTVKFNGNGATSGTMSDQKFTYGTAQNLTANSFVKTGYRFNGWSTSATGAIVHADKKSVNNLTATNNGVINLYANWIQQFTVNFVDGQGKTLKTQTVDKGGNVTAPANPTRTGYTFAGWDKALNNITANTTITAKWNMSKYTVSFVDGKGKTLKSETVEYNKNATAPANPTLKGSIFKGWDKSYNNIKANTTVTAQWENTIKTKWYIIKTKASPLFRLGTPDTKENIKLENANNKSGQKFYISKLSDGSYKIGTGSTVGNSVISINGNQIKYNASDNSLKWEVIKNDDNTYSFKNEKTGKFMSVEKIGNNAALTESATANTNNQKFLLEEFVEKFTVTFMLDDSTVYNRQSVKRGESAITPTNPTKAGKTFAGWDKNYSKITGNLIVKAIWK